METVATDAPAAGHPHLDPIALLAVAQVARDHLGETGVTALFAAAGLSRHLEAPPADPVPEAEVSALHRVLQTQVDATDAVLIADRAGRLAAENLLDERLPKSARGLRFLPPAMAARTLLSALGSHGHLVAGSGILTTTPGHPAEICIADSPICRGQTAEAPVCGFYAATFEGIFQALISPDALVRETECAATGAPACRFSVTW